MGLPGRTRGAWLDMVEATTASASSLAYSMTVTLRSRSSHGGASFAGDETGPGPR